MAHRTTTRILVGFSLLTLGGCAATTAGDGSEGDGDSDGPMVVSSGGSDGMSSGGTGAVASTGGASTGGNTGAGTGGSATGGASTGGQASSGGSSSGGTSSSGGAGTGGSTGGDAWASFDSDLEGLDITFEDTTGAGTDTATHDGATGDPSNGSAQLDFQVNGSDQKVFFSGYPVTALDLSGATITARVRLDSGLSNDPSCPGGAYVFAKSGESYTFARGTWTNLDATAGWVTITMVTDSPDYDEGFSASDVREIGVAVSSGGECGSSPYVPGTAHVDTISF